MDSIQSVSHVIHDRRPNRSKGPPSTRKMGSSFSAFPPNEKPSTKTPWIRILALLDDGENDTYRYFSKNLASCSRLAISPPLLFLNFCGRQAHTSTCACQMARTQTPHESRPEASRQQKWLRFYFCSGRCNLILAVKYLSIYLILHGKNILSNLFF